MSTQFICRNLLWKWMVFSLIPPIKMSLFFICSFRFFLFIQKMTSFFNCFSHDIKKGRIYRPEKSWESPKCKRQFLALTSEKIFLNLRARFLFVTLLMLPAEIDQHNHTPLKNCALSNNRITSYFQEITANRLVQCLVSWLINKLHVIAR